MQTQKIIHTLRRSGPRTGQELLDITRLDVFSLWQACLSSTRIHRMIAGKRFLRLDQAVEGYARLSPSIRREFQTYTIVGLAEQHEEIETRVVKLKKEIREISRDKLKLARETMLSILSSPGGGKIFREKALFIIGGDITYDMAHLVPRPEKSTGKLVRGSDLDIVVVVADDVPPCRIADLDEAIYDRKYYLLIHPEYREEIDYIIKPLSRVREQFRFNTFRSMVASKIIWEGRFLCGNSSLFETVKNLAVKSGLPELLGELEKKAIIDRKRAESRLLNLRSGLFDSEYYNLFFTREERMEDIS